MHPLILFRNGLTGIDANLDADNNQPRRAVDLRCMGR
jgi:hypothetical protein